MGRGVVCRRQVVAVGADRDELATRADLEAVKADIYRMMLVQTFAIVGAVVALVKLIP